MTTWLTLFLSFAAEADTEFASRLPRLSLGLESPNATEIHWRNGQRLSGELAGADESHLVWKCALFTEEMRVRRESLVRIDFAGEAASANDPFRFVFADGSNLVGTLGTVDGETVSLAGMLCGEITVRRDQLAAIERIHGPGVVAAGPAELSTGKATSKGRFQKMSPVMGPGGRAVMLEFNSGVSQELELPEKCLVELRLRIEEEAALALELVSDTEWISLQTWSDELVLVHGNQFASAGAIPMRDDGRLDLRLGWDRPARRCTLYARDGQVLGELLPEKPDDLIVLAKSAGVALSLFRPIFERIIQNPQVVSRVKLQGRTKGVTLENRGAGFVIERYQVTEWSGAPPPAVIETGPCIETTGETIAAEAVACDGEVLTISAPGSATRQVPLDDLRAIHWQVEVNERRETGLVEAWFYDGGLVRGKLSGIAEGKARIETSFSTAPVVVSLATCRALILPEAGKDSEPEPAQELDQLDLIAAGNASLRGTIQPTGGALPAFLPAGCDTPLTPRPVANLTMTRSEPEGHAFERAPVLLHTKSQESLPAASCRLDAGKIHFAWTAATANEVAATEIHAVQFAVATLKAAEGFDAPGWEFLGRGDVLPGREEQAVVLQPDTGIGHPYLLNGSDFQFDFSRERDSQMTSLRVRLFCQGTERNSDSINFLVAHYGRQIYTGLELGREGRTGFSRSTEVESETAPVSIEFRFHGGKVEMLVNGESTISTDLNQATGRRTGAGLVIETAAAWGNRIGPAKLSGFSMRTSPSLVSPPPFSTDAKRESLLLPRLRREPPPRHILIGRNGDLLRGEIGAMAGDQLPVRVGLNEFMVPLDRIAAVVWVAEADKEMEENVRVEAPDPDDPPAPPRAPEAASERGGNAESEAEAKAEAEPEPAPLVEAGLQWLDLSNGGRLRMEVESWKAEGISGRHPILGKCVIPLALAQRISLPTPAPEGALAALSGWKFENTIDPNPPGLEEADVSPLVGKPAPDFTLAMLGGEEFSVSKARGKVVVLDFWATWCVPCVRSLPALSNAMAALPGDKLVFVAVNEGESNARVRQFLQTRNLQFPVAFDPGLEIGRKYGAEAIPYTVVIDPDGTISHVAMGSGPDGEKKIVEAVHRALEKVALDPEAGEGAEDGQVAPPPAPDTK